MTPTESNNKRPSRCLSRIVRRCEIYNEINGTEYTPETYDAERTRVPRMIEWDQGWEACESMQTHRRVLDWHSQSNEGLRLRCGELSTQEIRSIRAVLNAILPPNDKIQP